MTEDNQCQRILRTGEQCRKKKDGGVCFMHSEAGIKKRRENVAKLNAEEDARIKVLLDSVADSIAELDEEQK